MTSTPAKKIVSSTSLPPTSKKSQGVVTSNSATEEHVSEKPKPESKKETPPRSAEPMKFEEPAAEIAAKIQADDPEDIDGALDSSDEAEKES